MTGGDIMEGEAEQGHQRFLAQGPPGGDAEVIFPVLSECGCSELTWVFSEESWIDVESHVWSYLSPF